MRIIVDAFGGDNAPLEILRGCRDAVSEYAVKILLTGDEYKIKKCAKDNGISLASMEIKHTDSVFSMEDEPRSILKENSGTSMALGLQALADGEGKAFVSAGSTGALVVGSSFIVKRIPGVRRAAIASILPSRAGPVMLLDCGASHDCEAEYLRQFALMGSVYMEKVMGIRRPRVGLANIGTEPNKGDRLRLEAFGLLSAQDGINFTGNIEARDIPFGLCDVVAADGFTGNIILKMYEGVAAMMLSEVKAVFTGGPLTKLSALMVKKGMMSLKKKMDYTDYGGAPLLGINGAVIKAHGSSDAKAFKNALRQAKEYLDNDVVNLIKLKES
ncbi:MAG: phosphate acyltransferase PlsX [Oscillospiraceae bacterium]|nr:phosphate acyltransferase PlsX [Oscillospiraceae bacterium]